MEPTEHEAEAQEAQEARAAEHAAQEHAAPDAAPEPKRRGRPPGSKNKPKQDLLSRLLQSASRCCMKELFFREAVAQMSGPAGPGGPARSAAGVPGGARPPSAGLRRPGVAAPPAPACAPKPVVEGPRLLQLSVALQQQRLQVVTGVASAACCGVQWTSCFYTSTLALVVSRS